MSKSKVIVIQQLGYLPWTSWLARICKCDVYVVYDTAQYVKNDFFNRNRIRLGNEWKWLTVPVSAHGFPAIKDVRITNASWAATHLETIRHAYGKAPYFDDVFPAMSALLQRDWSRLLDLQLAVFDLHFELLGISPQIAIASELGIQSTDRNERLVEICRLFGADTYLSGTSAQGYLNVEAFSTQGIAVEWDVLSNPVYPQIGNGFMPQMCALDLLMNCGQHYAHDLLVNGWNNGLPVVTNPQLINACN